MGPDGGRALRGLGVRKYRSPRPRAPLGSSVLTRVAALLLAVAGLAGLAGGATASSSSSRIVKGIYDESEVLYGNPDKTFPILKQLGTEAIRVNLYWGGKFATSTGRPATLDPEDPKFDWSLYDRLVQFAARFDIDVYFSVYGTPRWANGFRPPNLPPTRMKDLENFVYLAATRYGGRYVTPEGVRLPAVRRWLAWNEPNNPVFLRQQFKRVGGRWIIQSARDYAKICNAVVVGVRRARLEGAQSSLVACGVTAPRGNNRATSSRSSVSPLPFVRAMKAAGAKGFDAYAHHPYYGSPTETPSTAPRTNAVTLGNIDELIREVTRLWGRKRIWITEYGYQTNPPDKLFGVSPKLQARYMAQAYALAKRHPRIDTFFWFLLKDERRLGGWQSGLYTASGVKKPAFTTFRRLR